MPRHHGRLALGFAVAVVGVLYALVFGGGTVSNCLGPLGVTAVQCVAHGGRLPTTGALGAMVVAACAAGLVVGLPTERSMLDAVAAAGGALCGAIAYLLTRPLSLEGPDFDGTPLSITLPVEPWSLLIWSVAGCLLVVAAAGGVRGVGTRLVR